jgi:hypothetical protein
VELLLRQWTDFLKRVLLRRLAVVDSLRITRRAWFAVDATEFQPAKAWFWKRLPKVDPPPPFDPLPLLDTPLADLPPQQEGGGQPVGPQG